MARTPARSRRPARPDASAATEQAATQHAGEEAATAPRPGTIAPETTTPEAVTPATAPPEDPPPEDASLDDTKPADAKPADAKPANAKPEPETAAGGSADRNSALDHAKVVTIALVVIGHTIGNMGTGVYTVSFYLFIYLFHMPAFVLISGYLSRSFDYAPRRLYRVITGMLIPYVIGQYAYLSLANLVGHRYEPWSLFEPYYLMWFLIALFMWRMTTGLWRAVRWPITISILISLLTPLTPLENVLALNRFTGLLPFFVIGLSLRPEHLAVLRRRWIRILSPFVLLAGLGGAAWAIWYFPDDMVKRLVLWALSYEIMDVSAVEGIATRAGMLVVAALLTGALLALMPGRNSWVARLGPYTLYAYLLHGLIVLGLEYTVNLPPARTLVELGALVGAAVLAALLLMTPPVRWLTRWVIEPRLTWLLSPDGFGRNAGAGAVEARRPKREGRPGRHRSS